MDLLELLERHHIEAIAKDRADPEERKNYVGSDLYKLTADTIKFEKVQRVTNSLSNLRGETLRPYDFLPERKDCRCSCHAHPEGTVNHITACCRPDELFPDEYLMRPSNAIEHPDK